MRNLTQLLRDSDRGRLQAIADSWNVDARGLQDDELRQSLQQALLEEARASTAWSDLNEDQRMILITLITTEHGEMSKEMFGRFYGEITRLGLGQIQREQPHRSDRPAQALYYRGLIGEAYERGNGGTRQVIYVPEDLRAVLPTRQTGYAVALADERAAHASILEPIAEVDRREPADTTIIDDLTTLLAYMQRHPQLQRGDGLTASVRKQLGAYLLHHDERQLGFLFSLVQGWQMLRAEDGKWNVNSAVARPWLQANRHQQVQQLSQTWREASEYRELWQLRELRVDRRAGDMPSYDATAARANVLNLLREMAPPGEWWLLEDYIEQVKLARPDFQRPKYDRWYIQNEQGEYLSSFEHWDEIEGRVLDFMLTGPMHWLGLLDLAEHAARLTAYGRAFLGHSDWPERNPEEAAIEVESDGTLLVPRRVSQLTRFQLARFCEWGIADDPFLYRITRESLATAQEQNITRDQVRAFLLRALRSEALPAVLLPLFSSEPQRSAPELSLERQLIMRTNSSETLDYIYDTPSLQRYLEARLGPQAAIVMPRKLAALRRALAEEGINLTEAAAD